MLNAAVEFLLSEPPPLFRPPDRQPEGWNPPDPAAPTAEAAGGAGAGGGAPAVAAARAQAAAAGAAGEEAGAVVPREGGGEAAAGPGSDDSTKKGYGARVLLNVYDLLPPSGIAVRKSPFLGRQFYTKNDLFTKTGSGQT